MAKLLGVPMLYNLISFAAVVLLAGPQIEEKSSAKANSLQPDQAWKSMGRSLWLDGNNKHVVLKARVVLREGVLEHLLCLKGTKEHEAILATDAVPYQIHALLLRVGAKQGHPVRFAPKFEPPSGTPIAIELRWQQDGKVHQADARQWVKDEKANKPLAIDWVFAGSDFYDDPVTKTRRYAADDGDLFTVANFGNAILDLPISSSANDAERAFFANTDKIPPLGTDVFLLMGPRSDGAGSTSKRDAKRVP
jgi:hypothetical protein